jgi:hypothetical protein
MTDTTAAPAPPRVRYSYRRAYDSNAFHQFKLLRAHEPDRRGQVLRCVLPLVSTLSGVEKATALNAATASREGGLRRVRSGARLDPAKMTGFIDEHRGRFRVQPTRLLWLSLYERRSRDETASAAHARPPCPVDHASRRRALSESGRWHSSDALGPMLRNSRTPGLGGAPRPPPLRTCSVIPPRVGGSGAPRTGGVAGRRCRADARASQDPGRRGGT